MRVCSPIRRITLSLWLAAAVLPAVGTAFGQTGKTPLSGLYTCMEIASVEARAACFDRAAAELKAAEAAGTLTVLTPKAIEEAQVSAFGARESRVSAETSAEREAAAAAIAPQPQKDPDRVTLAVREIQPATGGNLRFIMENGQVWRQTDGVRISGVGKGPWTAEIRRAALGSFLLKLNGKTAVRVKRES
jgi:hypothetical protein